MNGVPISNLRYANNAVLVANDAENLQIIGRLSQVSEEFGLSINTTKFVIISRNKHPYRNAYYLDT